MEQSLFTVQDQASQLGSMRTRISPEIIQRKTCCVLCGIGYRDLHKLVGFASKKMLIIGNLEEDKI
jgi:hypothetical protein